RDRPADEAAAHRSDARGDRGCGRGRRPGARRADERRGPTAPRGRLPRRAHRLDQEGRGAGMIGSAVAKRYATALYDLAHEQKAVDAIGKDLADLAKTWAASEELRRTFENPQFPLEQKRSLIAAIADRAAVHPLLKNMLMM